MINKRILILEDDLLTLSKLFDELYRLDEELITHHIAIAVTVLSEYTQVEEYINKSNFSYDAVLLDRDCKAGGSFHVLDVQKIGMDKIIAISSVPSYNDEAREKGVANNMR